jgi:dihydroorotase
MAALTKGMKGDEMTEIGLLKAAGAVAFTDGDKSVMNALVMRRALTYARDFDALIVHHTEDPHLVGEGVMNEGEFASRIGLMGIPNASEAVVLERDMRLVALTGGRYHAAPSPASTRWIFSSAPRMRACGSAHRPRSIISR